MSYQATGQATGYNQLYDQTAVATASLSKLEARQLLKAAAKLQAARNLLAGYDSKITRDKSEAKNSNRQNGELLLSAADSNSIDEAIIYNRKLWSIFFISLSDDNNPLAPKLKNDLISLSVFVFDCSLTMLGNASIEDIDALIEINRTIARGLMQQPKPVKD